MIIHIKRGRGELYNFMLEDTNMGMGSAVGSAFATYSRSLGSSLGRVGRGPSFDLQYVTPDTRAGLGFSSGTLASSTLFSVNC